MSKENMNYFKEIVFFFANTAVRKDKDILPTQEKKTEN